MGDPKPLFSLLRLVALACAAAAPLCAQETKQPGKPQIVVEGDNVKMTLGEADGLPLIEFIKLTEQITGKVFTFTKTEIDTAPDPKIAFVGTVVVKKVNWFSFFQTMLYIKGFACILRDLRDSTVVQIVWMNGPARNEIQNAAKYVPPEAIPEYQNQTGVQILTSIMLEHVNATAAQNSLRPFFATQATQPGGLNFTPVGNRALLLVGFGPQVFAAQQLLKLVDVQPEVTDSEVKVVRLEHASAEELEPMLNEILNAGRGAAQRPPQQGVSGAEIPGQQVQLKILAHSPLNAIILSGSKEQLIDAQEIIARLDVPVEVQGGDTSVMRLKNVLSKDLRTTLNTFINEDMQAENAAQAGTAQGGAAVRKARKTVVVSHDESNSLLLSGTATKLKTLRKLIEENLDARQPQVLVECAVVELSTDDLTKIGVELGFLHVPGSGSTSKNGFGYTSFGLSTFSDTDGNGLPDTRLPDFTNPLQGVTGGIISGSDFGIPLLVNALKSDNKANILSLPSVVVNNNQSALVKTTEERPTQNTTQGTATTQSGFQGFQGAGIELNISPSISSKNYLRLNINLSVSRFLTAFDPTSSSPGTKATRQVQTQVTMPNGATMVLGGVIEDRESDTTAGIPFLKDIPILGYLFKLGSSQKTKTNLYFFLTPHILDEDDFSDLRDISFRKKLEAADFIGHRRIQLIDKRWRGNAERLEDPGATIEDYDKRGGFEAPYYDRAKRDSEKMPKGGMPAGPALPRTSSRPSSGNGK